MNISALRTFRRGAPAGRGVSATASTSPMRTSISGRARLFLLAVALMAGSCAPPAPPEAAAPYTAAAGSRPQATESVSPSITATTPTPLDAENGQSPTRRVGPAVFPGTGVMVGPPARPRTVRVSTGSDGGISFNFANADVRDVAREILGNQLHLGYVVDAKVQATITAQTGGPVPRDAVLPTFENVLRANGLALVHSDDIYRILPIEDAAKTAIAAQPAPGSAGYATRILPLRFVSAPALKSVLDPFVPPGGLLQIDAARNLLIVSGTAADLDGFADLVHQFDVDWLAGTSFALYPLRVGMAKDIATELEAIFGEGGSGPLAGVVRIVPVERLNAILVISPQSAYLAKVKEWIDRLDYGDDQTTPRLFEYRVQNSRAADLAAVLTQLLSPGSVSTVQPETAPGTKPIDIGVQQQQQMGGGLPDASGALSSANAAGSLPMMQTGAPTATTGAVPASPLQSGAAGQVLGANRPYGNNNSSKSRQALADALRLPGAGTAATDLQLPPVHVVADEKNNALVIFARPRDYKMIESLIKRLDIVPLQVLIEATIAEVTLNDNLQYGLEWFFSHASNKFELAFPPQSFTPNGTAGDINPTFPGFNYILGGGKAKLVLSALAQLTHVDVVSAPHLLVLDHQTAALQVGDEVPIISQTAQSVITANAPIVNSVQYLNTGVVLQVTPRVNSSGLITLDIDQQVSDVAATTTSTINSPTIAQRRIVTSVVVQDGQTIALGGLILDNQSKGRSGVPVLQDIPVLGGLFRTTTDNKSRTELLVLLSPKIIRNTDAARAMTDELRDRMRLVKPLEHRAQ
jgi:general secretion pathway protein D